MCKNYTMGYVEDIQKINKLAKEMLSHGMAKSLDEAVSKAQETLRKSGSIRIDLTDMKQKLDEQNQKKEEVIGKEKTDIETGQVSVEKPAMPRITWQEAMAKNTNYVVEQLKGHQKAFEQIGNEIIQLKREVQLLKRGQSINTPQNTKEQVINIEEPAAQQETLAKTPEQESHPKQGSFKPEDVSIEKVFYFGNK